MQHAWMRLTSGAYVDLFNLRPADFTLLDLVRSMDQQRRFNGHYQIKKPLSILQHSMLVDDLAGNDAASPACRYCALMHDLPEGLYGDIINPAKAALFVHPNAFEMLDRVVRSKFNIPHDGKLHTAVKLYDIAALHVERWSMWSQHEDRDEAKWPPENEETPMKWVAGEMFDIAASYTMECFLKRYTERRQAYESAA